MRYYARYRASTGAPFYVDEKGNEVSETVAKQNLVETTQVKLNEGRKPMKSREQLLQEKDTEITRLKKLVPAEKLLSHERVKESAMGMMSEAEAEIFANPDKFASRVER